MRKSSTTAVKASKPAKTRSGTIAPKVSKPHTQSHHVVPNPNGGWSVKKAGTDKASKVFEKKDPAITYARQVSRNQKTELVIHRKDGTIEQKDSHNVDPNPPRDRDTHK